MRGFGSGGVAGWISRAVYRKIPRLGVEQDRVALRDGSHEQFIAEHYWGYSVQRDGGTVEYRVEHPPWRIWPGEQADVQVDSGPLYGERFRIALSAPPVSTFVAEGSPVKVFRPRRLVV